MGCAGLAQTPQLARFTVEVYTQGDTLRDSVTGELLDRETPRAKAFQCVKMTVEDSKEVGNATFLSPPWTGGKGTLRKSGMGGQSGEGLRGRYFWGCGVKPQVQPTSAKPVSYSSGTILSLDDDPAFKTSAGSYRLVTPREAEITLGPAQNYLDYPRINPVKGNDTTGYTVSWKPVPGAVAYAVHTYGGDTYWKNSDKDWQDLGVGKALEQGVLLSETTCLIPGGMYAGPFRVGVDAISPDVYVPGDMPALGYSHSGKTLEVRPSMGAEPRNPDLAVEAEDKDADMRPKDPFRAAIFDGDFDRVSKMVESDPSLINQRFDVVTPLMMALLKKRRKITKFLLEHGADVNLADEAGQTPLDFACCFEADVDIVEMLLNKGARIEGAGNDETPLHEATRSGELELVRTLLKHGANPNSKDSQGFTPLDYSRTYERDRSPQIAALLRSHGAKFSPPKPAPKPYPKLKPHRRFPKPTKEDVFLALEQASSLELCSVDPVDMGYWALLGKTQISGSEKAAVLQAFKQGVADSDGMAAACFNPRHALVVRGYGKAYCLIICYECGQVYANQFDPKESYEPGGNYGESLEMLTTAAPTELFNKTLQNHQVKLPQH